MSKRAENETKNCDIRAENVEAKDFWNLENGLERQEQGHQELSGKSDENKSF